MKSMNVLVSIILVSGMAIHTGQGASFPVTGPDNFVIKQTLVADPATLSHATVGNKSVTYHINGLDDCQLIVCKADITKLKDVDAVVNAANAELSWGGGVCGAIFNAAGREALVREVDKVRNGRRSIPVGGAVITPIPASTDDAPTINNPSQNIRYVIHAVGPDCRVDAQNKRRAILLANAYVNSLLQADVQGLNSIAFPAMSTAIFGYPVNEAAPIAIDAILTAVKETGIKRIICVFLDAASGYDEYVNILNQKLSK